MTRTKNPDGLFEPEEVINDMIDRRNNYWAKSNPAGPNENVDWILYYSAELKFRLESRTKGDNVRWQEIQDHKINVWCSGDHINSGGAFGAATN